MPTLSRFWTTRLMARPWRTSNWNHSRSLVFVLSVNVLNFWPPSKSSSSHQAQQRRRHRSACQLCLEKTATTRTQETRSEEGSVCLLQCLLSKKKIFFFFLILSLEDEAHLSVATGAAGGGGKSSTLKKIRESFRKSVDPGKQAELQRALTILQTNRQTSSPTNSTKKKSRFGSFRDSSSNNSNAVVVSHVRQSSNTSISSNTSAGSPIIGDNTSGMTKSTSSTNIRSQLQGPQVSMSFFPFFFSVLKA